ncbi:hypothetical protein FB639_002972 [Coemansia asiatica]|nr:hypothetical protein FB639_002972 [Coemansia asiatica]
MVETAANTAEQIVTQTAQFCQQIAAAAEDDQSAMFTTPKTKRPSNMAFGGEFVEPPPTVAAGMFGPPSPNTTASFRTTTSVASEYSDYLQNSPMLSATKRQRPDSSSSRISRLQMAISRAKGQLDN